MLPRVADVPGHGLPERELRGLLEILAEVHHAEDLASFREGLLHVLPIVLPSLYTSYNELGPDGRPLVVIVRPEPAREFLERWGSLGHQNPLVQRYLATRDPRAYRMSDVIAEAEFRRLDLYREVFAPLGVHHQMAVTLPAPPRLLVGLAVVAPADYSPAQRRMLDLARPHLIQARANAEARERLRGVMDAIGRGMDEVGEAVVVVDDRDRIEFASRAGRDALVALDGAAWPDGARLSERLRSIGEGYSVVSPPDGAPLVTHRLPSDNGTTVFLFERRPRAVPLGQIEALGLTPREAQVLQCFMRGATTVEAATQLGASPRTVQKHCERIYRKLGVTSRVSAVGAAWSALGAGS